MLYNRLKIMYNESGGGPEWQRRYLIDIFFFFLNLHFLCKNVFPFPLSTAKTFGNYLYNRQRAANRYINRRFDPNLKKSVNSLICNYSHCKFRPHHLLTQSFEIIFAQWSPCSFRLSGPLGFQAFVPALLWGRSCYSLVLQVTISKNCMFKE